jgi:hypothetical protein
MRLPKMCPRAIAYNKGTPLKESFLTPIIPFQKGELVGLDCAFKRVLSEWKVITPNFNLYNGSSPLCD